MSSLESLSDLMTSTWKHSAFLIHHSRDDQIANSIQGYLIEKEIDCHLHRAFEPGDPWAEVMRKATAIIVLQTRDTNLEEDSYGSTDLFDRIQYALKAHADGAFVMRLYEYGTSPPAHLKDLQSVEFLRTNLPLGCDLIHGFCETVSQRPSTGDTAVPRSLILLQRERAQRLDMLAADDAADRRAAEKAKEIVRALENGTRLPDGFLEGSTDVSRRQSLWPGDIIGGNVVFRRIGHGAFAEIWRAKRVHGNQVQVVALRRLVEVSADSQKDFEQGARTIEKMANVWTRVAPILDPYKKVEIDSNSGEPITVHYFTMKYMARRALKNVVPKGGWKGSDERADTGRWEVLQILKDAIEGVAQLHREEVMHNDLHPGNILVDEEGRGYLGDFDLIRRIRSMERYPRKTGAVKYTAPELLDQLPGAVSYAADVFSMGLIVVWALSGDSHDRHQNGEAALREAIDAFGVTEGMKGFLHRATAYDPKARFRDAVEMSAAFEQVLPGFELRNELRSAELDPNAPGPEPAEDGPPEDEKARPPSAGAEDDPSQDGMGDPSRDGMGDVKPPQRRGLWTGSIAALALVVAIIALLANIIPPAAEPEEPRLRSPRSGPTPAEVHALSESSLAEGFVLVPGGTFGMGSGDAWRAKRGQIGPPNDEELPLRDVTLTHPALWVMTTEVTQGHWYDLTQTHPSFAGTTKIRPPCLDCPVDSVNWFEAVRFANLASERDGLPTCYEMLGCINEDTFGSGCVSPTRRTACSPEDGQAVFTCSQVRFTGLSCEGYRLPTEAEWEYTARAGTNTPYLTGVNPNFLKENAFVERDAASAYFARPVGQFIDNAWGLFDVHGNVFEWCHDIAWLEYATAPTVDPLHDSDDVLSSDHRRVVRGGSWLSDAFKARLSYRGREKAHQRRHTGGFRLVRTARFQQWPVIGWVPAFPHPRFTTFAEATTVDKAQYLPTSGIRPTGPLTRDAPPTRTAAREMAPDKTPGDGAGRDAGR